MMENKKKFQQTTETREEAASPKRNMDRFNKNELNNPKTTEIRTETKIDDKPVLDVKEVIRTEVAEAPVVLEHVEQPILKQERLATDVEQHAVANDVVQHVEVPVVEQQHRNVIHEHHQDVITEQHKNVIVEHHQNVIHKHIQPVIQEEVVHEIHKPVIHEKTREVIHEIHKPIIHEEHTLEFREEVKAPVVEQIFEQPIVEKQILETRVERSVQDAKIIEQPLPENLQPTLLTTEVRQEVLPASTTSTVMSDKAIINRQMENLDLGDRKLEDLSEDELIKLRVKGALESLKQKVIEGEAKELIDKNVITKDVRGEEITKII